MFLDFCLQSALCNGYAPLILFKLKLPVEDKEPGEQRPPEIEPTAHPPQADGSNGPQRKEQRRNRGPTQSLQVLFLDMYEIANDANDTERNPKDASEFR